MTKFVSLLVMLCFIGTACKVLHKTNVTVQNYRITGDTLIPDKAIEAFIIPYKEQVDKEMNSVIGEVAKDMTKAKPESTLGNWVADLIHKKSEDYLGKPIDFAASNYGGLRINSLPKGDITKGKIFELMPFDNMLVVLEIPGDTLQVFLDLVARAGGWPMSKHIRFTIKDGKATDITIKGKPIESDKNYTLAISDFVANGGDRCFFFQSAPRENLGKLFRDAMIEFVEEETKAGRLLNCDLDGRIKAE